jgi:hypothetical protein
MQGQALNTGQEYSGRPDYRENELCSTPGQKILWVQLGSILYAGEEPNESHIWMDGWIWMAQGGQRHVRSGMDLNQDRIDSDGEKLSRRGRTLYRYIVFVLIQTKYCGTINGYRRNFKRSTVTNCPNWLPHNKLARRYLQDRMEDARYLSRAFPRTPYHHHGRYWCCP